MCNCFGYVWTQPFQANGEVRSRTEWHRVVIFDQGLVDLVENYVQSVETHMN